MIYKEHAVAMIMPYVIGMARRQEALRDGGTVDDLHQFRVHSRRLINALWLYRNVFDKKDRKRWCKAIRRAGKSMNVVRDLDVHLKELLAIGRKAPRKAQREGIRMLRADLRKRRQALQPELLKAIKVFQKSGTLKELEKNLTRLARKKGSWPDGKHLPDIAGRRVDSLIKDMMVYQEYVGKPSYVKELHQMRIAVKHIRYTLECYQPYYGVAMEGYVKALLLMHNLLGDIHDDDVWLAQIKLFKSEHDGKDYAEAIEYLKHVFSERRRNTYYTFRRIWKQAGQQKLWDHLPAFIREEEASICIELTIGSPVSMSKPVKKAVRPRKNVVVKKAVKNLVTRRKQVRRR